MRSCSPKRRRVTLEVPAAIGEDLYRKLDAAVFAEDVLITDECAVWVAIGVHGARAAAVVARTIQSSRAADDWIDEAALAAWPEFAHVPLNGAGRLLRHDPYGVPGFVLRVPRGASEGWTSRLRLAGATGVAAADLEFARIEAGRPEFLIDMDADTIPLEAGIEDRAISFTKGCYVGQEVIVRVVHRGGGRVARRLVGLRVGGKVVPAAKAVVRHDARDDRPRDQRRVVAASADAGRPRLRAPRVRGAGHHRHGRLRRRTGHCGGCRAAHRLMHWLGEVLAVARAKGSGDPGNVGRRVCRPRQCAPKGMGRGAREEISRDDTTHRGDRRAHLGPGRSRVGAGAGHRRQA